MSVAFDAVYLERQVKRSGLRRMVRQFYLRRHRRLCSGPTLDFGCGAGDLLAMLPPGSAGVEINPHAVAHARARGLAIESFASDADAPDLPGIAPGRFETLFCGHVLEHLDDPVGVLRRVGDEWLTPSGRLFLVCPNANAPSRQIAVHMGLITHNAAVTDAERAHGHRITYSLDTLERDARAAGLKVVHRSGIFFKALANFQWDRLLATDIISPEYLEGCYQLGHVYPDLCSSIFLLCERGDR